MISKNKHVAWTDAKHEAIELSLEHGHAWIVMRKCHFVVRYSSDVDDVPQHYVTEFKDGIQQ